MLDLNPHNITEHFWWYDDAKYIDIIHEIRDAQGNYIRTDTFKISRFALESYLKRAKAADRSKARKKRRNG